jgi:hypothetical protein
MKSQRIIARDLKFGPFRTEQFNRAIDDKLHAAAVAFLVERVLPYLTVDFSRMEGSITSWYDSPEFVARPELTCRFKIELSFHSPEGADYVAGEMILDAVSGMFLQSPIRPLKIHALNPPPPRWANAPLPKRGVCPRCFSPVRKLKPGFGLWTGCKDLRPPPYTNSVPASGAVYYATCETCGLELSTSKEGSEEPDPANDDWRAEY